MHCLLLTFRVPLPIIPNMVGKRAPTAERFLDKFTQASPDECWVWRANKNGCGYGLLWSREEGRKVLAHRYSYEYFTGRGLKASEVVLHACDNPSCVNPSHLRVGTQRDNMLDKAIKERHGPQSILTARQVISLLRDYISGMPRKELARKYGLRESSLSSYTDGDAWRHLHGKHGCPTLEDLQAAKRRKPGAKVTAEVAAEIRSRLSKGELGKDLAVEYGLHKATISDIKLRKIWAD